MPGKLYKAQTKDDVIALFHPELLKQIPADLLDDVAQSILNWEISFRSGQKLSPEDLETSRIYTYFEDQITQVDYEGQTYKIS